GATALYDFMTQMAAYDSPIASFLDQEIREQKNYPMVCQSLQQVAAYLKFDWEPYRTLFHARLFDFWSKLPEGTLDDPEESRWYTGRARFDSQIPLEYSYGAWNQLDAAGANESENMTLYRAMTPDILQQFQQRRLEAIEWIASDFKGNARTEQRSFSLPDLASFDERAPNLAQALDEFVTIERHVWLSGWKRACNAPPERRVLSGQSLTVRYVEADQLPGMAAKNRDNQRRKALYDERKAAFYAGNPDAKQFRQTKEERAQTAWSHEGDTFRLQIDCTDWDCDLDEALALTELGVGDRVVINTRLMVDGRLPADQQVPFTPPPKRMLYGVRADITSIVVQRDAQGKAQSAVIDAEMCGARGGGSAFQFGSFEEPFIADERYTLDPDPNNIMGLWEKKITEGLVGDGANTLYQWLISTVSDDVPWSDEAAAGQQQFLNGLDALIQQGQFHDLEPTKRGYLSRHGEDRVLLVQGPPGTGKSFTTAFAILARVQGAMAAGLPFRVLLSCKTHAATDVLLKNVRDAVADLHTIKNRHPDVFRRYFDERLIDLPLYRLRPKQTLDGVIPLRRKHEREKGAPAPADVITGPTWCVAAGTPGGIYGMITERWSKELFGHDLVDCVVLDEASQMNLPEAIMASLPLKPDGRLIVVGDPRQMPPIVHHDWIGEPRRTFAEFKSYQSLYEALAGRTPPPPQIKFAESFRLHADLAEFLRQEIYRYDGINFHSRKHAELPSLNTGNPFIDAVLAPQHPLVVIVHDEHSSQVANPFERELIAPVLEALAAKNGLDLDPRKGLGVVVPHRKQRAALQEEIPCLSIRDTATGIVTLSAVDTVERFQGDERKAIVVDATESDREYLLTREDFLLDPRRLTVAVSRAQEKMILVAARSVFTLFSADDETYASSQIWKH
ncbi:MAG TPA: ATP-binding protein, partial [Thermomicrobiales bacterium]|nr:ATP-binding protein [Thermomicrobiales bacterium]